MQLSAQFAKLLTSVFLFSVHVGAVAVAVVPGNDAHAVELPQTGFQMACGTPHVSTAERHDIERKTKALQTKLDPNAQSTTGSNKTINVHFTIVTKDDGVLYGGNIPASWITNQVQVLNNTYNGTGLSFVLANTQYIRNEDWFYNLYPGKAKALNAMKQVRRGGAADLNVITAWLPKTGNGGQLLGHSSFPWNYQDNKNVDGILLHYHTMPGGAFPDYNQGKTLTHEVGHWVGLYHTFQTDYNQFASCDPEDPQDMVDDTPLQNGPSSDCPTSRDSCPNSPGLDSIHNYMDYTSHPCMTEFSAGQIARLHQQMKTYRGVNLD